MGLLSRLFGKNKKSKKRSAATSRSNPPARPQVPPPSRAQAAAAAQVSPRQSASVAVKWIGAGQQIKIHGYVIAGGMLYVGQESDPYKWNVEPSLIDPTLPVRSDRSSPGPELDYWPSYSRISPENRATYLAWLSSGRRNPSTPIGYVFIFMYGLERRVLVDILANGSLASDLPAIRSEMTALLSVYGPQSQSFRGYATSFLDLIDVVSARYTNRPLPIPELRLERFNVPASLTVELGRRAAAGNAIPADLALAWAWYLPENSPHMPATRCKEEFAQLFKDRFNQKFPSGMPVRPGKSKIRLSYHPASSALHQVAMRPLELPDVFSQKVPGRTLIALFDNVSNELDAYSRFIGRNPDGAGSLAAAALLPPELIAGSTGAVNQLRDWANAKLGQYFAVKVPGAELVDFWPSAASGKLAKAESVSVAQLLGNLGYGIEPDVRFGGSPVTADGQVVLFKIPSDSPHSASPAFSAATTLVQLAAAVGSADGEISFEEIDHLGEHLESSLSLQPAEKTRLHAHLMWLTTAEVKLTSLKKRLEDLNLSKRQSIGSLMISLAAADGVVSPGEVTILTRIFQLLSLDPNLVTSYLHSSLTGSKPSPAVDPVVVRPAGTPDPGYRIPPRPPQGIEIPATAAAKPFSLDVAAIQNKLAETAEISVLLGNLFNEEETYPTEPPQVVQPQPSTVETVPGIAGLDSAHSLLLRAVAKRNEWSRAEFEDLAGEYHLMPDGAIDVLNEASYDATGEPIIEGDDMLTINSYAVGELLK